MESQQNIFGGRRSPQRPHQDAYTRQEAAEVIRISIRKLDELIATKEIKPVRIGRRVVIARTEIERYLARNTGRS